MIQDLEGHVFHNEYHTLRPDPQSFVLAFSERGVLGRLGGAGTFDNDGDPVGGVLELPRVADLACDVEGLGLTYACAVDDWRFFLVRSGAGEDELARALPGFAPVGMRELRFAEPRWKAFTAAVGRQLLTWYEDNAYCGRCGCSTTHAPVSRELVCPACSNIIYPKIAPAVIVGVLSADHERIVVTRYAHRSYKNYALVAGFTEVGETLEQTVAREVAEEVGLSVRNVRYWGDQPWPFTATQLMGFFCEVDGTEDITVDTGELKMATWMTRDEIPMPRRDTSSLTNAMIEAFVSGDPLREDVYNLR